MPGEPIDPAFAGTKDPAPDGYANEDGEGKARGSLPEMGDPCRGYAEPGAESEGAGEYADLCIGSLMAKSMEVLRSPEKASECEGFGLGSFKVGISSWSSSAVRFRGFEYCVDESSCCRP